MSVNLHATFCSSATKCSQRKILAERKIFLVLRVGCVLRVAMTALGVPCHRSHHAIVEWMPRSHEAMILPEDAIIRHGRDLAATVLQEQQVVILVLGWELAESVVGVIQRKPVARRDHCAARRAILAGHFAQILIANRREVPAVAIPALQVGQRMAFAGWKFPPQHVDRNTRPLRAAFAEDREVQTAGRDAGDADDDAGLVAADMARIETVEDFGADVAVKVLRDAGVETVVVGHCDNL